MTVSRKPGHTARDVDAPPSAEADGLEAAAGAPPAAAALEKQIAWLRDFETRHGRPLRVLHVGNIANNAFLNAKFLRRVGVEADVLSYNYSHVMALPEWEEVELTKNHGSDNNPHFSSADVGDYVRPDWFIHGPLNECVDAIALRNGEHLQHKSMFTNAGQVVARAVGKQGNALSGHIAMLILTQPRLAALKVLKGLLRILGTTVVRIGKRLDDWLLRGLLRRLSVNQILGTTVVRIGKRLDDWLANQMMPCGEVGAELAEKAFAGIVDEFDRCFPQRRDKLSTSDILPHALNGRALLPAFGHYDIVQCYATAPITALLNGTRPYVAFEHGTLRDFTMKDDSIHRLTALAYRKADHTFITNGDCLDYARRLGITDYSAMIHPIDVEQHRKDFGSSLKELRQEIGAELILFCPIRHDWLAKGTDIHLRALPIIKQRCGRRVKLVLIRWGQQLDESNSLLSELGCANDVLWRRSMCRITMVKHIRAADVVLDQMALPHFGATAPQAMAAGTPVISSYDPESTRWIIPEPAPILPAFSPEEVADAVLKALDQDWRLGYEKRARQWVDAHHHPNKVIFDHLTVYRRVLENHGKSRRVEEAL